MSGGGRSFKKKKKRIIAAMAAIVSMIIVGLSQFDQIVVSIYAYFYGRLPFISSAPVPSGLWTVALLTIFLVADGIYTVVRHPQYLGFMLVTLGQFLVWPTIATAILWPWLAVLYYRQAKREEAKLFEKFFFFKQKTAYEI